HGIGLRCVQALPADKLDSHPVRDMRTPKELIVHMYGYLRVAVESVAAGTLTWDEAADVAAIKTKDDLVAFARNCWHKADAAFAKLTDEQLAAPVKAPWGDMRGDIMVTTIVDEFLHHRGQLYAFLRQLGVAPPVNWDYENSEPELQPKQMA